MQSPQTILLAFGPHCIYEGENDAFVEDVRANGYYHGGTSGSHYSYRSDSCYALWKNNRLVLVESRPA